LHNFNLVVTTQRGNERACIRELIMLVDEAGGPDVRLRKTWYPGLIAGTAEGDPVELVRKIRPLVEEDPWDLRFMLKLVPVQKSVQADVVKIKETVGELAGAIPAGSSFKISVSKRGSDLRTAEIIKEAASVVVRKVDLEKPDRIVQIEIIDDVAGVSVLCEDEILSVTKLQEKAMDV
jgi:tRNA acetyltransferase TAN1